MSAAWTKEAAFTFWGILFFAATLVTGAVMLGKLASVAASERSWGGAVLLAASAAVVGLAAAVVATWAAVAFVRGHW